MGAELKTQAVKENGLNARFGTTVHCVAAEPHATFVRVGILDDGEEVAYEIAVLGRLRHGYRVLQMRSLLGTRISLCFLLVRISFASEANMWVSSRQARRVLRSPALRRCCMRRGPCARAPLHSTRW